jgi:hypothetical protein
MRSALFWGITQNIAVIPYRRFMTIGPSRDDMLSETSTRNYGYKLRNISEELRSQNTSPFPSDFLLIFGKVLVLIINTFTSQILGL